jgi:hypothetical protein
MSMLQWAAVATASVALFASVLLLAEAGRGLAFEDATAPNSTAGPNIAPHSTSPGTTPTSVETKGGGTDWGAVAAIAGVVAALATTATVIVMRRQGRHAEEKARLELRAVDPVARLELRDDLSQWQEMLRAALGSLFADLSAMSELRSDVIDSGHPVKPRSDLFPSAPARSRYHGLLADLRNHVQQVERASDEMKNLLPEYALAVQPEESQTLAALVRSADYLVRRFNVPEELFLGEANQLLLKVLEPPPGELERRDVPNGD